jgi:hypothetical protein
MIAKMRVTAVEMADSVIDNVHYRATVKLQATGDSVLKGAALTMMLEYGENVFPIGKILTVTVTEEK